MVCAAAKPPDSIAPTPHSDVAGFLVERNYRDIGCDSWNTRKVQLLCAKTGDTPAVMAARLRINLRQFTERCEKGSWTKQDGLILTVLEREIDFLKGGTVPTGRLTGGQS